MRHLFGGGAGDFVAKVNGGNFQPAVTSITLWTAQTSGTQITDLLDVNSIAITSVATDGSGQLPVFSGPDGTFRMWADAGGATRALMLASDDSTTFGALAGATWTGSQDFTGATVTGISGSGGSTLVPTAVKTSAYTAVAGDFVPVDTTSGAVTVTLPNAPADKTQVGVKHVIQGSTNAVTVACAGAAVLNKIGGSTTLTLPLLAQGAILQYKSSGAIWYILSDDLALSQLDARYVAATGAVTSVAGRTGAVVLAESDITSLTSDLAAKAPLASPALTGVPTAPTAAGGTNTTQIATTAFVTASTGAVTSVAGRTGAVVIAESDVTSLTTDLAAKAPLASPALTGTPTVPTASGGTNTTQAASTAFVASAVSTLAPLASPTFTGTPAAPTVAGTSDSTTKLATTAFVQAVAALLAPLASPTLTGTPAAPTAAAGTNTTQVATTAFVTAAVAGPISTNTQTSSYTLVLADAGKVVEMNLAGANTLTVPPNSSVAFPTGTIIEAHQYGAGQTTVTAGAGVTIRNSSSLTTRVQYSTVALRKRATDEWILSGDVS